MSSNGSILTRSSINAIPAGGRGMVLPFEPLALTFHRVNYYVPLPVVRPTVEMTPWLKKHTEKFYRM